CPACDGEAVRELFRIESDPIFQPGGDLAVYACLSEECGEEFDSDDPRIQLSRHLLEFGVSEFKLT
ncbi:hypothetical protein, partial [Streptosporangium sp. NPDC049644]